MWATTPVRPFDDSASNLKRILCAFGLAIHELTAACLALNRETQGAFSTRSTRPSRSYACLGWYWDESHYRVLLMTVSSQRGEIFVSLVCGWAGAYASQQPSDKS